MNYLKHFSKKYPFIFAIIIFILTVLLLMVPVKSIFQNFTGEYTQIMRYAGGTFIRCLGALLIIFFMRAAGFGDKLKWQWNIKFLLIIWPAIVLILGNLSIEDLISGKVVIDTSKPLLITLFCLKYIGVGLFEEFVFRGGIMYLLLLKWGKSLRGIYLSVILSSIMFGLLHLLNLHNGKIAWQETTGQVFYAAFLGVMFTAIVLRTKNIWLAVIIHAVLDIAGSLDEIALHKSISATANLAHNVDVGSIVLQTSALLPFLIYGLFILRKVSTDEIS